MRRFSNTDIIAVKPQTNQKNRRERGPYYMVS